MKTKRSKINRNPLRGFYDKDIINKIIDEAFFCHVSFVQDDQPYIIPTIHSRIGNKIILHGAKASRLIRHIAGGNKVSISMTILDSLVLARSVFHHSMNYRSVVLFGKGEEIVDKDEKLQAFEAISNHMLPGRWEDARQPDEKEINSTAVVAIEIEEASAKIRTGPPLDDKEDYDLPVWAGVLPVLKGFDKPQRDPKLKKSVHIPHYLKKK